MSQLATNKHVSEVVYAIHAIIPAVVAVEVIFADGFEAVIFVSKLYPEVAEDVVARADSESSMFCLFEGS